MNETSLPVETMIRPIVATVGTIVIRNPHRYLQTGEWVVTALPQSDGWVTTVEWAQADGSVGVFRMEPGEQLTVRTALGGAA